MSLNKTIFHWLGMEKEQKLQDFSGFDAFSLLALIVGCVILVSGIVAHGISAQRLNQARVDCDVIGLKLLSKIDLVRSDSREIASKPDVGPFVYQNATDPWGHPYRFCDLVDTSNRHVVVVYSAGPNGRFDTHNRDFLFDHSGRLVAVKFQGDDIGSIQRAGPRTL